MAPVVLTWPALCGNVPRDHAKSLRCGLSNFLLEVCGESQHPPGTVSQLCGAQARAGVRLTRFAIQQTWSRIAGRMDGKRALALPEG